MKLKNIIMWGALLLAACNNKTDEKGISLQQKIQLPAETGNLDVSFENVADSGTTMISIRGTVAGKEEPPLIVLLSDNDTLVYNSFAADGQPGSFAATINKSEIPSGSYRLGAAYAGEKNREFRLGRKYFYNFSPEPVTLPAEAADISYSFEQVADSADHTFIAGWAFVKNVSTENAVIRIVLRSPEETLAFPAQAVTRKDVTAYFASAVNIDNSGFSTVVSKKDLKSDTYSLGILVESGGNKKYLQTDKHVSILRKKAIAVPSSASGNVSSGIDVAKVEGNKIIVSGWAFLKDKPTDNTVVYVVFQGPGQAYRFNAIPAKRPDVTRTFRESDINLDNSGFELSLPRSMLDTAGTYQLGLFLENKSTMEQGFALGHRVISVN
jgi:hypothetical protein